MEINTLLSRPEGKTLEFKRDLSSTNGLIRTVIAFANTAGGSLVLGVEDKTHYISGIKDPLKIEEKIASLITDNINPRVIPEIDIVPWRDTYFIVVRVFPSSYRPHFIKKYGIEEGVYIRVGSTNRRADTAMIRELERVAHNQSYDEQPLPQLSSEAIDFKAASEQFSAVRNLKKKDLESLGLVVPYQGFLVPTVAGMVLFGKEREKYFPDAWVQAGRFKGLDKSHIVDTVNIHGYLIPSIDAVLGFVEKHAMKAIEIEGVRHKEVWSIPRVAVRETIINAIAHADYSQQGSPVRVAIFDNRIEIENPGLLRFGLTTDDIKGGLSKLRNRTIGKIFHTLGIIERWGSGIQRIITTCKENNFATPIFEEIGTHFRVTLFTIPPTDTSKNLDRIDKNILDYVSGQPEKGFMTKEIANNISLSTRATRTRLLKLIDLGYIVEVASSAQDPNRKYYLTHKRV